MNDANNLELEIDVDERPGVAATRRFNEAMHRTETAVIDGAKRATSALDSMTRALVRGVEVVGALALVGQGLRVLFQAQTIEVVKQTSAVDDLVNAFRGARLAMSPTMFTAMSVAAVAATESLIKLAYARRQLVEAEGIIGARTGVSYEDAATLGALGRITRSNAATVFAGYSAAQLREIAVEFEGIRDPADRGARAVELFGDKAEEALPMLNRRLKENIGHAQDLAAQIDGPTRRSMQQMNVLLGEQANKWQQLRDSISSATEQLRIWGAKIGTEIGGTIGAVIGGAPPAPYLVRGDFEPPQEGPLGYAELSRLALRMTAPHRPNAGPFAGDPAAVRRFGAIRSEYSDSLEGVAAELGRQRSQFARLLDSNDPLLANKAVETYGAIRSLEARKRALEDAQRLVEAVDALIDETRRVVPMWQGNRLVYTNAYSEFLSRQTAARLAAIESGIRQTGRFEGVNGMPAWAMNIASSGQYYDYYFDDPSGQVEHLRGVRGAEVVSPFELRNLDAMTSGFWLRAVRDRWVNSAEGLQMGIDAQAAARLAAGGREIGRLGRQARLDEQVARYAAAPGSERGAIEEIYARRLSLAQQIYEIERLSQGEVQAGYRMAEAQDEARIDRIREIAQEQRQQYDRVRSSIEGLIDAAVSGSRNLLQAIGGMFRSLILQPMKEFVASWGAAVMTPFSGRMRSMFALPMVVPGMPSGAEAAMPEGFQGFGAGIGAGSGGWGLGLEPIGPAGGFTAPYGAWGAPGGTAGFAGPVQGLGGLLGGGRLMGGLASLGAITGLGLFTAGLRRGGAAGNAMTAMGGLMGGMGTGYMLGGSFGAGVGAPVGLGAGLMLGGWQRGGILGGAMSVGGGALAGATIGSAFLPGLGTIGGALVGAGIGLAGSLIRLFGYESDEDHTRKLIRQIYGVDIQQKSVLQQIIALARERYGGQISMAVYTADVRNLVELYAQSTGQGFVNQYRVRPASLVGSGGGLYQAPTYVNGAAYAFASTAPTYGGVQTSALGSAAPTIRLTLDAGATRSVLNGRATSLLAPGFTRG